MVTASILIVLIVLIFGIIIERYKNKHLCQTLSLTNDLKAINLQKMQVEEEAKKKEKELSTTQNALSQSVKELIETQNRLSTVNAELRETQIVLKQKEELLREKTIQNQAIITQLHREDFEIAAESVTRQIREASKGHRQLKADDWRQLFHAVDCLYPDFKALVIKNIPNLTDSQMKFCYLVHIGLTNGEIENLLDVSRGTIWRWRKTFEWAS